MKSEAAKKSDGLDAAGFVAAKLRWQLALLCDTSLSTPARLFGGLLMHDFDDRYGGCSWRSQGQKEKDTPETSDTYRARTGFNVRTIQLAALELEAAGYIRIDRGRGRGHSNKYWPLFEKAKRGPPFPTEKAKPGPPFDAGKAKHGPPFPAEMANSTALKGGPPFALLQQDSNNKRAGVRFADHAAAVAAVTEVARLGEGEAVVFSAGRYDVDKKMFVFPTEADFVAVRQCAGPALKALGLRLACGASR